MMSAFIWGLGKHGQLCNGKTENQLVPCSVTRDKAGKKLGPILDIGCGAHYTAVVCSDGSLFTSGCGKYGRLGQGWEEADCSSLAPVTNVLKVKKVSCGFWHAACVTEDNQVYVWGYSKAVGGHAQAAGKRYPNVGVPQALQFQLELKILGVSCGHNYTFIWTTDGQTLSWGRGQHGVLGHGSEQDVTTPKMIESLRGKITTEVGAGHSHCGVVCVEGELFMTGSGFDGALGLGTAHRGCAFVPTKVSGMSDVQEVSCSKGEHHHHTIALTKSGGVFVWGDGYKGKLGLGDQKSRECPTQIPPERFHNEKVVRVCAGGIHSAASTEAGSVFSWGCGSDGRLGHPEAEGHRYLFRSDIPRRVEALVKSGNGPALVTTMSLFGILVSCALALNVVKGHSGHGGHGSNGYNSQPTSFSDPNIVGDADHMMQHMKQGDINKERPMSPAEMEFHYFRLHDTNNDNMLDGLELLKGLSHMMPPTDFSSQEINGKSAVEVEDMRNRRTHEMMNNYVQIIDNVLMNDDRDKDGYLTYPEYSLARKRDVEKMKDMQEQMLRNAQNAKENMMAKQKQPYNSGL